MNAKVKKARRPLVRRHKALRRVMSFRRKEDGAMVVFTLFVLAMMLIVGGMAVDIMRFENYRARLQSTLDRAVLAAADLDICLEGEGTENAEAVLTDYILKGGFGGQLDTFQVNRAFNSCSVVATASIDVNTIFMQMVGVDQLSTPAGSAAIEALNEIEISLVLDVSGSMGSNNRLVNMRDAARDFAGVMFDDFEDDALTISVVPYSTQVNLGPALAAQYNLAYGHNRSYCVDLPASTYSTTALNPASTFNQAAHVDVDSYATNWGARGASRFVCNPDSRAHVVPLSSDPGAVDLMISRLQSNEWTSIEMGAKWGVALLDPSTQPVVTGLIGSGHVSNLFAGRPLDYNTQGSLKVMVLMTDGENTRHYELDNSLRSGMSDVWRLNGDTYFVGDPENGNQDGDRTRNELMFAPNTSGSNRWTYTNSAPPTPAQIGTQLSWPALFNEISLDGHAYYFRAMQSGGSNALYNQWYNNRFTVTDQPQKDVRLDAICSAAKAQGIIIFTIGFEVSNRAADVMESCASSPSHFYRVEGLEIATAFASIASNITSLRLVQ